MQDGVVATEPLPVAQEPAERTRDAAVLLPALGLFLLMPPVIGLFALPLRVAGVPLIVLYLFGVWFALVLGAALLAWVLRARRSAPPAECSPPS
ncbi:MAG: hypothetical protein ABT20_07960 [Rubrivivax sp. SCN 70-15]|nr:MAG: hypothetical protein ABT20_07960 [Rubrivivax sp. SCN 70-15]